MAVERWMGFRSKFDWLIYQSLSRIRNTWPWPSYKQTKRSCSPWRMWCGFSVELPGIFPGPWTDKLSKRCIFQNDAAAHISSPSAEFRLVAQLGNVLNSFSFDILLWHSNKWLRTLEAWILQVETSRCFLETWRLYVGVIVCQLQQAQVAPGWPQSERGF